MEQLAYSIDEFCGLHRLSRTSLYRLWRQGIGPAYIKINSKILISKESAQRWRLEREQATTARAVA
jgi:hypothetical protein